MKTNNNSPISDKERKRICSTLLAVLVWVDICLIPNVYAEDNPISVINKLSDFIFQITQVVGGIIAGYGIVQLGLSFTSHDPSQKSNSIWFIVGGFLIMSAKYILNFITS